MRSDLTMSRDFVEQLKLLFNLLDTTGTGIVPYEKLCLQWRHLPRTRPPLPEHLLDCVGQLTPSSGQLDFEHFVHGVRLALSENATSNPIASASSSSSSAASTITSSTITFSSAASMPNARSEQSSLMLLRRAQPPLPPPHTTTSSTINGNTAPPRVACRFRPVSTQSYASIASSGMPDIPWRNSNGGTEESSSLSTPTSDTQNISNDPGDSRVTKHVRLLDEETELVRRGADMATRLLNWYGERLVSLEKRRHLLGKAIVNLDWSVQEQRLNFLRAHITEVNRRTSSLMETSEKGFPTHLNLAIRNQMPQHQDDQLLWLHRQNRHLTQELGDKTKQLEGLQQQRVYSRPSSERPSALVRPALQQRPPSAQPTTMAGKMQQNSALQQRPPSAQPMTMAGKMQQNQQQQTLM